MVVLTEKGASAASISPESILEAAKTGKSESIHLISPFHVDAKRGEDSASTNGNKQYFFKRNLDVSFTSVAISKDLDFNGTKYFFCFKPY